MWADISGFALHTLNIGRLQSVEIQLGRDQFCLNGRQESGFIFKKKKRKKTDLERLCAYVRLKLCFVC